MQLEKLYGTRGLTHTVLNVTTRRGRFMPISEDEVLDILNESS